jgi:hypothetical protein
MPRRWAVVLLLSFVLYVNAVYRQHHAAILQNPTTVLLIGGAAAPNNFSQLLDIRKQQTKSAYSTLPVTYHTAAQTIDNGTLVLFGATNHQANNLSTPLWIAGYNSTVLNSGNSTLPPLRYGHSSISTTNTIYILGGISNDQDILTDIWKLSLLNMSWSMVAGNAAKMAGHSSIMYNNWIISCFGFVSDSSSPPHRNCFVFDLVTASSISISYQSSHRPRARAWASLTLPTNSSQAILYGGQDDSGKLLSDLWTLDLSDLPRSLDWSHIASNHTDIPAPTARAGHVALQILPQQNTSDPVLMIHGGEGPNSFYNDSTVQYLDITTLTWISPSMVSQRFNNGGIMMSDIAGDATAAGIQQYDVTSSSHSLSGGAIGGIVVGVLCCLAAAIALFIWRRHRRRLSKTSHIQASQSTLTSGVLLQSLQRTLSEKEDLPYITQPTPVKAHDRRSYFSNQFRDSISIKSHSYVELLEAEEVVRTHTDDVVQAMSDTTPDYSTPQQHYPPATAVADQPVNAPPKSNAMEPIDEDETSEHKVNQGRKQAPNPLVLTNSRVASMKGKAGGSRVSQLLAIPSPGSSPSIDSPQTSRLFLSRAPSSRSTGRSSVRSMQWVGFDPSTRYSAGAPQSTNLIVKNARDSVISSDASDSGLSLPPQIPFRNSFGEEFKVTWPTEDQNENNK